MRAAAALAVLVSIIPCSSQAGTATASSKSEQGSFAVSVTTAAVADKPGVFTCRAVLKNSTTDEVIAAPSLVFRGGERVDVRSTGPDGVFRMSVLSDEAKNKATVTLEYAVGDEVRFAPTVQLELR